jgi:eukaryotic-like serine/threonine-protein kinase
MREPAVGDQIDQFQVTDVVARTATATIFKAIDTTSGALSALKVPLPRLASDAAGAEQFRREEVLARRLEHPAFVRVLTPPTPRRTYIAMEFVEGRTLRELLQAAGRLPAPRALELGKQLCRAVVYLHGQGVIHRDLKPENVIVTTGGQVKIIDLGSALAGPERRAPGADAAGTPDYMAPEQLRGRRADARTDVYALGTILYELLTGALPYEPTDPAALLATRTREAPRSPGYHVPDFDPVLEAILLRAIAQAPRDRYPSAQALLSDLEDPSSVVPIDQATGLPRRREAGGAGRLARLLVVGGLVAGLSALVWAAERQQPHGEPEGRPPARGDRSSP